MSWDLLLLPIPAGFTSDDGGGEHLDVILGRRPIPNDLATPPLGSHEQVKAALLSQLPSIDFWDTRPWGSLGGPTWSIELDLGAANPIESITLSVRGKVDDALQAVFAIARAVGCCVINL
ncbi:hypothetical protein ABZW30_46830 [Kitasatospora sp. NPDC004669]|uniref:hypothetical protein n=1 Tax=Kitasatospora sp. NPDC004669 TaxID=3154555 RepID=UPI0033A65BA0